MFCREQIILYTIKGILQDKKNWTFHTIVSIFANEMAKRSFISVILLFTISLVLMHNIVPHHHHAEISDATSHDHKHDHDKQSHQHEHDGLLKLLKHFSHCTTSEISSTHVNSFQKAQVFKYFVIGTAYIFAPSQVQVAPEPIYNTFFIARRCFSSAHTLRGPPALLI